MPTSTDDENTQDYVGPSVHRGARNDYDDVVGAFQPPHWRDGWDEAVGNTGARGARVLCIGDSITYGQPGTYAAGDTHDHLNQGWTGKFRDFLASYVPGGLAAEFYSPAESLLWDANFHDDTTGVPHAPVFFADNATTGPNAKVPSIASPYVANGTITYAGWWWTIWSNTTTAWTTDQTYQAAFTSPYADTIKVEVLQGQSPYIAGTATWKYGTDPTGAVTATASIPATSYLITRKTVWSGAASRPTIYFGGQGGLKHFTPYGFVIYRTLAGGLQFARAAYGGNTAPRLTQQLDGTAPDDKIRSLLGGWDGTNYDGVGFPAAPDLVVWSLGMNDCTRSSTADYLNSDPWQYEQCLRASVEAGRRGKPNQSWIVLLPYHPPQAYGDNNGGFAHSAAWVDYIAAATRVADEYGCAVLNLNARWGMRSNAKGYTTTGDGHPITAGHADMAAFLAEVLR